jgi:hypothetical protein
VCALGAVGQARGIDMTEIDPEDYQMVADKFGIPYSMACEIMYENDETFWQHSPEERWRRMRRWAERELIEWEDDDGSDKERT